MSIQLGKDSSGNIVVHPVTEWATAPLAGMYALLAFEYRLEELSNETGAVQFVLTPQQCLELAEVLTRRAKEILGPSASVRPN